MSVFRSLLQKAARVLASQVARNSLFEKPGERKATPPLSSEAMASGKNGLSTQRDGEEPG